MHFSNKKRRRKKSEVEKLAHWKREDIILIHLDFAVPAFTSGGGKALARRAVTHCYSPPLLQKAQRIKTKNSGGVRRVHNLVGVQFGGHS